MSTLLSEAWHLVLEAKSNDHLRQGDDELTSLLANYRTVIDAGHGVNPPVVPTGRGGRTEQSKAQSLLDRLDVHMDDVLRCVTDFSLPFDNNSAERDARVEKIAQEFAGDIRSTQDTEALLHLSQSLLERREAGR